MLTKNRFKQLTALLAFMSMVGGISSSGQSGRRGSKPNSNPPPVAAPSPANSPAESSDRTARLKLDLLVAADYSGKRLPSEARVYASNLIRLRELSDGSITDLGELGTSEVIKRAKQEQTVYVALLKFEIDAVQDGKLILNSQNLEVQCHVYEPKTGKRIVKDKTYYQPVGPFGSRTPGEIGSGAPPVKLTTEAAGASVADQIRHGLLLALRERSSVE
ncbi:MAG TPA: hypothetical protein VFX97_07175 [Pyrinomonadaceae bacterium]|nr:hypothetical protein [Pyrinomonadaceae bacterium]